jgi:hypothetical protein
MLVGTAIPFALRDFQKESDEQGVTRFSLVGECLMEGKAWTDLATASDEIQSVDII